MQNAGGSGVHVQVSQLTLFVAVLGIALVIALPHVCRAEATSFLVWGNVVRDDNTNEIISDDRIHIQDGGTYPVSLHVSKRADVGPSGPEFSRSGVLFRIPDPQSSRVRVEWIGGPFGVNTLSWEQPGVYELDVYKVFISQNDRTPFRTFLHLFFGDNVYAQSADDFIETIRFTVTDETAVPKVSNVLFIPGMESSRLYTSESGSERKVWEPGFASLQSDAQMLYLNSTGVSLHTIYTKSNAALDQVGIPFDMTDIYRTFLLQLVDLKTAGTINHFGVFPYDWRMSPIDIVQNGTPYNDGTHYPVDLVASLAASSKTGKVTIVAHSNGGLVTKALMQKLVADGHADLVDKIIFVDVPQTGTPKAIASMLHGDFQNLPGWSGFIVSQATARGLGENMPDAFDLLPSTAYFAQVAQPVIDLSAAPGLRNTSGISTSTITSSVNLKKFITGAGGRQKPAFSDIETPDVLSATLLNTAAALHQGLDSWTPPAGVQVIQIAGWGLDTPAGITYTEKQRLFCGGSTCVFATTTQHTVNMTEDGDETVVIPSQVATTSWPTYYIAVSSYNHATGSKYKHSNITETQPFQGLFSFLITASSSKTLPAFVTTVQPSPSVNGNSLRLRVLSPVSLDAYDSAGHHTGMAPNPNPQSDLLYKQEQIPGSYYEEFGEGKYIGLPGDGNYQIKLHGLDTGTFTFEITPVVGGVAGTTTSYADIPVTASTTATLGISGISPAALVLDFNGDGKPDATLASSTQSTDPLTYARLIKTTVGVMDVGAPVKKQLLAKLSNVIYSLTKTNNWDDEDDDGKDTNKTDSLVTRLTKKLDKIEAYIQKELGKPEKQRAKDERISQTQAAAILNMIEKLKLLVKTKL